MSKKKKKKKSVKKKTPASIADKPKITPYPTAGPKVTEFEQKLDEQLAGAEPNRGPGRPRTKPETTPEPEGIPIEIVAGTVKMPFELWSIGQGVKELALSDTEARQLAEPVKQLLDYYLPLIPAIAYAWISVSVSSFWIMRARLLLIAEIKKQRQKVTSPETAGPQKERGQGGPVPSVKGGQTQGIDQSQIKQTRL